MSAGPSMRSGGATASAPRDLLQVEGLVRKIRGLRHQTAQIGGSGWLDSLGHFLSGAWRITDYAAVCRVVRWSSYTWTGVWPPSA